jgi:hypothetical protein
LLSAPRTDPYVRLSRIRLLPRVSDDEACMCSSPYAAQRLCHACPARRPGRALLFRIPRGRGPSLHRLLRGSLRFVRRLQRYYGRVRLPASVHHRLRLLAFPMRTLGPWCHRSDAGPPRFRRDPLLRDGVFDHGRASAPRMTAPHVLPSTLLTGSASASFCLSRLNSPPHSIVVYASLPPLPATTQHSLPGARYGLPGPDFHRLDHASLPGAQAIQHGGAALDCFASLAMTSSL